MAGHVELKIKIINNKTCHAVNACDCRILQYVSVYLKKKKDEGKEERRLNVPVAEKNLIV